MNRHIIETAFLIAAISVGSAAANGISLPTTNLPMRIAQVVIQAGNVGQPAPAKIMNVSADDAVDIGSLHEVADIDLAKIFNGHWVTTGRTVVEIAGKTVIISGSFDREQNAYISILIQGQKTPIFFDLASLALKGPGSFNIGNAGFTVYVAANAARPLKSRVVIEDEEEEEVAVVKVGHLLDAVVAAGTSVGVNGLEYRVFYFSDINKQAETRGRTDPAQLDPKSKSFAFIYKEVKDGADAQLHVFLVPTPYAEDLPAGKAAEFKAFENKPFYLRSEGGRLKIYELP